MFKLYSTIRDLILWNKRGFLDNSPQFIKQKILKKNSIKNAVWIESGTYLGSTTSFLSKISPHVHTIEPEKTLYLNAKKQFFQCNVTCYNDTSENIIHLIIGNLDGEINFWLDGHYSGGITFKGDIECPVLKELETISQNLKKFKKICIFIDDARCFFEGNEYVNYPSINKIIDWARNNNFVWKVEHDIIILSYNAKTDL